MTLLIHEIRVKVYVRRVNKQVQNYKTYLKNSHFGVEKVNFSTGQLQEKSEFVQKTRGLMSIGSSLPRKTGNKSTFI